MKELRERKELSWLVSFVKQRKQKIEGVVISDGLA